MAKQGMATATPRLRFPEFRGPTWKSEALGSVADVKTGPFGSTLHQSDYADVGTPIVTVEHLSDYGLVHTNLPLVSDDDRLRLVSYALKAGDIVLSRVGSVDRNSLVGTKENGWLFSGRLLRVRTDAEKVNSAFLSLYFQHEITKRAIRSVAVGQTMPSLNTEILNAFPVLLATLPEQQKIADCLTSLDEVIAAQGRKVDALKAHKRGLMQQLFPREGETRPRLRFPEFCNAPEWEECTTRSVCERIMDGTHFSPKSNSGPRPYLTSKNIREGRLDLSNLSYISEDEHREIYAKCPVRKFDVLLTKDGANTGNCAVNTLDYEFSLLSSVAALRGEPTQITQEFLYQTLASERLQRTIINSMSGQAITRITLQKLGNYVMPLPGLHEQQRIADCLSSLDVQIIAETNQLAALKSHKRGLMQQLFPTVAGASSSNAQSTREQDAPATEGAP